MSLSIPVAFICDDNYALPTAVAITSMGLSKKKSTRYEIYILGMGLSEDSKKRLSSLNREDMAVKILEKSFSEKQAQVVQVRERVTPAALLKFELPYFFPELDKLLYLDSDMLIKKDLSALYNTELGGAYAGVVNDAASFSEWGKKHREWLHFKEDLYFNSGMLLLNLKKLREDSMPEKLLDYRLNGINYFMDQDTLNVVFRGNICLVSPEYNILTCFFAGHSIEEMENLYRTEFPDCVEFVYQNAAIIHFGDARKPWRHYMGEYLSGLYNSIYKYSPYADRPLILEGDPLVQQERWLDDLKNSASFRIGRSITWLPRKIRDGVRCCREHGLRYAAQRFVDHITGRS